VIGINTSRPEVEQRQHGGAGHDPVAGDIAQGPAAALAGGCLDRSLSEGCGCSSDGSRLSRSGHWRREIGKRRSTSRKITCHDCAAEVANAIAILFIDRALCSTPQIALRADQRIAMHANELRSQFFLYRLQGFFEQEFPCLVRSVTYFDSAFKYTTSATAPTAGVPRSCTRKFKRFQVQVAAVAAIACRCDASVARNAPARRSASASRAARTGFNK